jgi:hypothetical protein
MQKSVLGWSLVLLFGVIAAPAFAQELTWVDARELTVEGKAFRDTQSSFDRLPARAEHKVRKAVWNLSRHSAGIALRFVSDAPAIHARYELISPRLAMPHMAATGVSGLDLYTRDAKGKWRWLACSKPTDATPKMRLIGSLPASKREYMLYFPLYNGVKKLEVGVPAGRMLQPAPARPEGKRRPIVFYGTSITHGACASRPGMVHTALLGRRLDRPVVNLGFSGNGRMELEVAQFITEIDAEIFVIDCLPNIRADKVRERTRPLVELLRKRHPKTPVVLVEDRNYADAWLVENKRKRNAESQAALREVFAQMQKDGIEGLHYIPAIDLLGEDGDGTVDSSHPNDLGFWRQANAFERVLRPLLTRD